MKKKGFTLVELVAAIAILSICIGSISLAFVSATRTWDSSEGKVETMSYAQGIAEAFKGGGTAKIKAFGSDTGASCFAYFDDDYNNFTLYFNSGITAITNAAEPTNFTDWFNNGPAIQGQVSKDDYSNIDSNLFESTNSSYNSVTKVYNSNAILKGRKFGAYIMLEKDTRSTTVGNVYYVKVRVWNMKNGSSSQSVRELYISG